MKIFKRRDDEIRELLSVEADTEIVNKFDKFGLGCEFTVLGISSMTLVVTGCHNQSTQWMNVLQTE